MRSRASASVDLLRLLLSYTKGQGLDRRQILSAASFDAELLKDREARIPFKQYQAVWISAAELSRDEDFGLHFGEAARHFPAGHLLNAVMMNSPTVSEALERFFRFHGLMSDAVVPQLKNADEHVRIVVEQTDPGMQLYRHYNEANLCVILTFMRSLSDRQLLPMQVCFTHAAPADPSEHERIFGCELHFGQTTNQLLLERELLDQPLQFADPELLEGVERLAEQRLARSTSKPGWAQKAERSILRSLLDGSKPAVEAVAHDLAVSVRHLQGQLKDEGSTYQQVLDQVRKDLALDYLEQEELSLGEVAFLLGYAEQSAFNHAFKRWTGSTPKQAREKT
jgi:AraC-like DNA-binding protein